MDVIKKLQSNATTVNPQADPIVGKYITQAITHDDILERAGMGDGPANNHAVIPAANDDNVRRAKQWVDDGSRL